jgi:hypothetical protein
MMSDSTTTTKSDRTPSIFDSCEPRQDVLTGELAEDQFAASLADVAHSDDAPDVYADPRLFFEYIDPDKRDSLHDAARDYLRKGGDSSSSEECVGPK